MRIEKKNLKLAKQIVKTYIKNDEIDEKSLLKTLSILSASNSLQSRSILRAILFIFEKELRKHELIIESAFQVTSLDEAAIKKHFEALLKRKLTVTNKINKNLIGGLKIKITDTEWDNSVLNNINSLRKEYV